MTTPPLPLAILAGGMRCGSRAFQRYLSQHPQVATHRTAHDPHFFSSDANWAKGVDWYLDGWSHADAGRHRVLFESSTHYAKYPAIKDVPERMRDSGLPIRVLFAARDPVARAESHLIHNVGKGYVDADDADARARFLRGAAAYSSYRTQLSRYLDVFARDDVFVFTQERLAADPQGVMDDACAFLGLDPHAFGTVRRIGTKMTTDTEGVRLMAEEEAALRRDLRADAEGFLADWDLDGRPWTRLRGHAPAPPPLAPARRPRPLLRRATALIGPDRHALLTVDVEALPARAPSDHVDRLVWGRHEAGTGGIAELCDIADAARAPMVFFTDMVEEELYPGRMTEAARYLAGRGQDVQLHTHPELLGAAFWRERDLETVRMPDAFGQEKASWVIGTYAAKLSAATGRAVTAFRAGSYRYGAATIRALGTHAIPLSFNNQSKPNRADRNFHQEVTNTPYRWSNGVVEVPLTSNRAERRVKNFCFPPADGQPYDVAHAMRTVVGPASETPLCVLILHSHALLHADGDGYMTYRDDRRAEELLRLARRLTRDYDVVTSVELLGLIEAGRVVPDHTVALPPP